MRKENPFWPNEAPSAAEAAKQWGRHGLLVHLSYTQIYTKSLIVLSVSLLDSHPSCGATTERMRSIRNVNESSIGLDGIETVFSIRDTNGMNGKTINKLN